MKLTKDKIVVTKAPYEPKAILILIDEMSEVMNDTNYRLVTSIQNSLGSIARLGRAAGVHLCLATQRPSSNVINADLKNNIQMSCLLGDFDTSASTLLFDKDISHMSKPEIKGRGFLKSGKGIYEFQSYWTEKDRDFELRKLEDEKVHLLQAKDPNTVDLSACITTATSDPIIDEIRKEESDGHTEVPHHQEMSSMVIDARINEGLSEACNGQVSFEEIGVEEILKNMQQIAVATGTNQSNECRPSESANQNVASNTESYKKPLLLKISKKDEIVPHAIGSGGITLKLNRNKAGENK